jgi:hypothetical protein
MAIEGWLGYNVLPFDALPAKQVEMNAGFGTAHAASRAFQPNTKEFNKWQLPPTPR